MEFSEQLMDEWGPEKIVVTWDHHTQTKGILVIDNTVLGPGKGGIRILPDVTIDEVARLARAMTWKNALAEIPFGGAKAGIIGNPEKDKIGMVRAFARRIRSLVPREYIAGPDMNTGAPEMAAFADEIGDLHAATGKPREFGGIPHELGSTGYGVAEATEVACKHAGIELRGATVAIEGFGNVGTFTMKYLSEKGARIVGVSDSRGCIYNENGLDYGKLLHTKWAQKSVVRYSDGRVLRTDELFGLDVDILIPGARPNAINEGNAKSVKAKVIVEAANIPIEPKVEAELHSRGVLIVPDIVANAGGVISSYVESIGGTEEEMFRVVRERIRRNVDLVLVNARRDSLNPRDAALMLAKERVRRAMEYRGLL